MRVLLADDHPLFRDGVRSLLQARGGGGGGGGGGAQGYLLKGLQADEFFGLLSGVERGEAPISRGLAGRILEEFARRRGDRPEGEAGGLTERGPGGLGAGGSGASNRGA